jgi:dinuclear metal center YbgI/SA1388 family protein
MAVTLKQLVSYTDTVLAVEKFRDYCPNGLQVEGRSEVRKIVAGVTACQALIDAAIEAQADLILVHHGYFWKGEAQPLVGIKGNRIRALMQSDVSLLAYHLPLDAHPEWGNNVQLAKILGISVDDGLEPGNPLSVGNVGTLAAAVSAEQFALRVADVLGREPQLISGGERLVKKVAWCTGSAERMIEQADRLGADMFISGEISEPVVHYAREAGIHYLGAGHHATERYGVQALGEHLAAQFDLEYRFIDIDNPV